MTYYTYIITNYKNTVLYTGMTNNLQQRVLQHKKGINDSFSRKYRLYKLVWFQEFEDVNEAISAEKRIKGWKRSKKMALIRELNPVFRDLMS